MSNSAFSLFSPEWQTDPDSLPIQTERIAYRMVARSTDNRTVICALVPPKVAITHGAPYLMFPTGDREDVAYVLGVLSSIPLDWQARRTVEINLTYHILNGLSFPRPAKENALRQRIISIVVRLTCIDDRYLSWGAFFKVDVLTVDLLEKDELNDIFANKKNQRKVKILHKFINFLWSMRNCLKKPEFLKHFTLYLKAGKKKDKNNQEKDSSLIKLLCFDPSLSFSSLKKENFRSIMFTSGTLSPISYYEIRLGLKFGVIFNNDNVFDSKKNLKVAVINKSLDKRQNFNFTYRNRENIILFKELGNAIISIISVIPNGVLVFFPSYGLMQKCADIWRKLNFIEEIRKIKPIFVDNSKHKNEKNVSFNIDF